jgi:hypothetical protein
MAVVLVWLLWKGMKRPYSWETNFYMDSKGPYGTNVAFDLLKASAKPAKTVVLKNALPGALPSETGEGANYVFIGKDMYIDADGIEALLEFVAAGNNAFISAPYIPYSLVQAIYPDDCEVSYYEWEGYGALKSKMVQLNLVHPGLELQPAEAVAYQYRYYKNFATYSWSYIEDIHFCNAPDGFAALGRINETYANFARVPYEDGFVYLHTTPLAFSNYHLLRPEALSYADRVFSHLGPGAIYWDEGRKRSADADMASPPPSSKGLSGKGPLTYILSQPPLAAAWYLVVLMGLLFLLLRSRRRQRIMPVLEPNTNTSLEFVSTIGRLYFLQNNHRGLCLQKMRLLQQDIRERYGLHSRDMDDAFMAKLLAKSEVRKELLDKIFLINKNIQSSNIVTDNTLAQFHGLIEEFYKTWK